MHNFNPQPQEKPKHGCKVDPVTHRVVGVDRYTHFVNDEWRPIDWEKERVWQNPRSGHFRTWEGYICYPVSTG